MRSFSGTSMTSWSVPYLEIDGYVLLLIQVIKTFCSKILKHSTFQKIILDILTKVNRVVCQWRPVAHVCGSLIGKTSEDEEQELVVVPLVGKVPETSVIGGKAKEAP